MPVVFVCLFVLFVSLKHIEHSQFQFIYFPVNLDEPSERVS